MFRNRKKKMKFVFTVQIVGRSSSWTGLRSWPLGKAFPAVRRPRPAGWGRSRGQRPTWAKGIRDAISVRHLGPLPRRDSNLQRVERAKATPKRIPHPNRNRHRPKRQRPCPFHFRRTFSWPIATNKQKKPFIIAPHFLVLFFLFPLLKTLFKLGKKFKEPRK